jgi:hypothetical protein
LTPASTGAEGDSLEADSRETGGRKPGARLWPILITLGLVFVILVNAIFIYIAVSGADEVVPSYLTEER